MKNILITLLLFAATINAQEFKVTFLPSGNPDEFVPLIISVTKIPDNHNGTFTYFILSKMTGGIENIFYSEAEAISYSQKINGKILITANIY